MKAGWNVGRGWIRWDYRERVSLLAFTTTGSLPLDDGQTPSPPVIMVNFGSWEVRLGRLIRGFLLFALKIGKYRTEIGAVNVRAFQARHIPQNWGKSQRSEGTYR